jgi:hypothetical protein
MQFATSFPFYNIGVVATGVSCPFVTDLLNHDFKPYRCPRIKKMIEQVLLKEIAVLVEDYIGFRPKTVHYLFNGSAMALPNKLVVRYNDEPKQSDMDKLHVQLNTTAAQLWNEKPISLKDQESWKEQQMDVLITDYVSLDAGQGKTKPLRVFTTHNDLVRHVHIHYLSRPSVTWDSMNFDLLVIPHRAPITVSYSQLLQKFNVNYQNLSLENELVIQRFDNVIDLKQKKVYYQNPAKQKTNFMEFMSWSVCPFK